MSLAVPDLLLKMNNQGVYVRLENHNLRVDSIRPLTNEQRVFLKRHKRKIIDHLYNAMEAAEERAAIMEHDGGLTRQEAEQHAIQAHMKPYLFKLIEGGGTYISDEPLAEARKALKRRYREKLVLVTEK